MPNVVIDIATQYTGNPAFKKATNDAQKLEKSVAKLGKQLAGVFAASKLYAFGKASVKAFAADEKAARSLSLALANTGNAFADIQVEGFIADLQRTTGVLDDYLRPAFRTLITATGDVKKSQDALALALDISAGTGKDLGSVTAALAKGFSGQTTALSRLGAGLSKATLKTGNMDDIVAELNKKFSGQALAAAEGYSGQMDILAVASNNAKEIIGKGLLDAMSEVAGDQGIGGAAKSMENFATQTSDAIYGIGVLTAKLKGLPGAGFISDFLSAATQVSGFALLSKFGKSQRATPAQSPGERKKIDQINKDAIKYQKQQNDLKKIDNDNTTRKIKLTGDDLALKELEQKFDVTRIGLYAALTSATDKETEARILSKIAIYESNSALAGKIKAEDEAANAAIRLAAMFDRLTASSSTFYTTKALETAKSNQTFMAEQLAPYYGNQPSPSSTFYTPKALELQNQFSASSSGFYNSSAGSPTYIINASGIGDQQIASVVQGAIQDLNRYGNSTTYAGAI